MIPAYNDISRRRKEFVKTIVAAPRVLAAVWSGRAKPARHPLRRAITSSTPSASEPPGQWQSKQTRLALHQLANEGESNCRVSGWPEGGLSLSHAQPSIHLVIFSAAVSQSATSSQSIALLVAIRQSLVTLTVNHSRLRSSSHFINKIFGLYI